MLCERTVRVGAEKPNDRHRLRARRERRRSRCAAERDHQLPPSDGDCHTPLPCEVRKRNDTTLRATPSVMTKFMPAFLLKCVRSQANERLTVGSVPSRVRPESAGEAEATSIPALLNVKTARS